jgi:hypothetical protein
MDPRLVQRTRYLLQARVRRAKSCPAPLFPSACLHLVEWVQHHPILSAMTAELRAASDQFDAGIAQAEKVGRGQAHSLDPIRAASLNEHAALCLRVMDSIANAVRQQGNQPRVPGDDEGIPHRELLNALAALVYGDFTPKEDESIERLRDIAVDGVYEFLDEGVDSRNAIMGLLIKYKQRSEWFHRARLRALANEGVERRRPGEESLAVDLQEYVFDQGVEFSIEPTSASGEADLVLRDVDGSHVVLDAKYISAGAPPSVFKDKLARGFHQVARYCNDFHEPAGYLVVFIADEKLPRLPVELSDGFEYITVKGRQVYYIPVIIADAPTASRAGVAQEVPVTLDDLVNVPTELVSPPAAED